MSQNNLQLLFNALNGTNQILILPHNDPDPDAVASAVALRYLLAQTLKLTTTLAYYGIIGRAENKALVNYLDHPFQPLGAIPAQQLSPVALVDTQPGAGNNALPAESTLAIVVDHHPWRQGTAQAAFHDIRTTAGATSTILTEYLQAAGIEPEQRLATALFYGIKTDTMGLSRGTGPADAAAYFYLQPRIDEDALIEIERAQLPVGYFKSFDTALRAARIYNQVIVAYIGSMTYPDLAAEMADILLRLEGIQWVICMGMYKEKLILSVRTRNHEGGAGRLAQAIVGKRGVAGGHGVMAGGYVPLQNKTPGRLAAHLSRKALHYLDIPPDTKGTRLI